MNGFGFAQSLPDQIEVALRRCYSSGGFLLECVLRLRQYRQRRWRRDGRRRYTKTGWWLPSPMVAAGPGAL